MQEIAVQAVKQLLGSTIDLEGVLHFETAFKPFAKQF